MVTTGTAQPTIPALGAGSASLLDPGGSAVSNADVAAAIDRAELVAAFAATNAPAIDRDGAFPVEEFQLLADARLLTAPLARRWGGLGLGTEPARFGGLLRLLTTVGRGNLAVGRLYEGHVNAVQLIETFGTAEQIERVAGEVRDGCRCAVWNTEGEKGVQIEPIGDGRVRLRGAKTFASGAGHVERPLITGALPDGRWQMMLVPADRVSCAVDRDSWHPLGMRATASFTVDFTDVELQPEDLIGVPGDYYRAPWFGAGAVRFAAVQLGGAQALLDQARGELRARGRTADPHQRLRFGAAAIAIESAALWLREVARLADRSPLGGAAAGDVSDETMIAYANLCRTAVERSCLDVLEAVERGVGARALLRPHPIERIGRDLSLYLRQPAPDDALASAGGYLLDTPETIDRLWSTADW